MDKPRKHESASASASDPGRAPGSDLETLIHDYGVQTQPPPPPDGGMVVGEVLDTHHPHRPGRVLVRWYDVQASEHAHWLPRITTVPVATGSRVLLSRPTNWPEWLVVGALSATPAEVRAARPEARQVVQIESGESVRVESRHGEPLFELSHREGKPFLRLQDDICLEVEGTFAVAADRIELRSGQGGTDSRSDGEMIFRSPRIRLN